MSTTNDRNQAEIRALKDLLSQTDYVSNKLAEGASNRTEYLDILDNRDKWRTKIDKLESIIADTEPTFTENQQKKLNEILIYYDNTVNDIIKKGYSGMEIETFDIQRQGAKDIIAGDYTTDQAVFVSNLAATRSATNGVAVTAEALAQKIILNVSVAEALKTAALGKQQGQYDLALAATTQQELDNIVLSFDISALM